MFAYLPPFVVSQENSNERPSTLTGRHSEAEKKYEALYSRFGTHDFLEWVGDAKGEQYMRHVPPYSERFDEFLAFWLGFDELRYIPLLLESIFPDYDSMDLSYMEDVVVELEKISKISILTKEEYIARKGSGQELGPTSYWRYGENLLRAKRWLEEAKDSLRQKQARQIEASAVRKPAPRPKDKAASVDPSSPWDTLFMGGFTIEKLNLMLSVLGIITEDRYHTAESKPRNWRAIVEALRDNKRLIRTDAPRLHNALVAEFDLSVGSIPSVRTLQNVFDPNSSTVSQLYERASAWLKTN